MEETQARNTVRCCPVCGHEIPDWKTKKRVQRFMADGVGASTLMESVTVEPVIEPADEPQIQVTLINPLSGPVAAGLALSMVGLLGSPIAFQFGLINGPLSSLLMVGSFCAGVFICGSSPRIVGTTARQVDQPQASPAPRDTPNDYEPQADEISKPGKNSIQIRFYEPPLRPSGQPVEWAAICYACRQVLKNTPFSEREIAGPKGAKISGPDFRLLSRDFRRRGYTKLLDSGKTIFTERGQTQVRKLAALPY